MYLTERGKEQMTVKMLHQICRSLIESGVVSDSVVTNVWMANADDLWLETTLMYPRFLYQQVAGPKGP